MAALARARKGTVTWRLFMCFYPFSQSLKRSVIPPSTSLCWLTIDLSLLIPASYCYDWLTPSTSVSVFAVPLPTSKRSPVQQLFDACDKVGCLFWLQGRKEGTKEGRRKRGTCNMGKGRGEILYHSLSSFMPLFFSLYNFVDWLLSHHYQGDQITLSRLVGEGVNLNTTVSSEDHCLLFSSSSKVIWFPCSRTNDGVLVHLAA